MTLWWRDLEKKGGKPSSSDAKSPGKSESQPLQLPFPGTFRILAPGHPGEMGRERPGVGGSG